MSKGGYLGGSTILYINSKFSSEIENHEIFPEIFFQCEICKLRFSYTRYFEHLKIEHSLKGCIACGCPYEDTGEEKHTCPKCGKFIRLKNFKNKNNKKHLKQKNVSNKSLDKSKVSKKNKNDIKIDITIKKKKDTFGLSIKDLIMRALAEKENT
jgi:predicted RNA-binding Zn-ribbon protein involved in translation (DUF1610 family)